MQLSVTYDYSYSFFSVGNIQTLLDFACLFELRRISVEIRISNFVLTFQWKSNNHHTFTFAGRQYDKNGNLKQWWDDHVIREFKKQAQCMINQYGNFTIDTIGLQVFNSVVIPSIYANLILNFNLIRNNLEKLNNLFLFQYDKNKMLSLKK